MTLQAHRASATWETRTAMGEMVLDSIAQALGGRAPDDEPDHLSNHELDDGDFP